MHINTLFVSLFRIVNALRSEVSKTRVFYLKAWDHTDGFCKREFYRNFLGLRHSCKISWTCKSATWGGPQSHFRTKRVDSEFLQVHHMAIWRIIHNHTNKRRGGVTIQRSPFGGTVVQTIRKWKEEENPIHVTLPQMKPTNWPKGQRHLLGILWGILLLQFIDALLQFVNLWMHVIIVSY